MNPSTNAALKAYKKSQELDILSADPAALVVKVYDYVLSACKREKADEASQGIALLIDSLDFEEDLSMDLFQLYRYAMERAKAGGFQETVEIISGLKEAWLVATSSSS